jgi:hypothetical protein
MAVLSVINPAAGRMSSPLVSGTREAATRDVISDEKSAATLEQNLRYRVRSKRVANITPNPIKGAHALLPAAFSIST